MFITVKTSDLTFVFLV